MKFLYPIFAVVVLFACSYLTISGQSAPPTAAPEVPSTVAASMTPPSGRAAAKPVYLTGEEKTWSDFPKAPVAGSDVDQADLKEVLSVQASRTEEQKAEAMKDKHYVLTLMTDVISPDFKTKYPQILEVLTKADQDEAFINNKLKNENARPRPYEAHKEVQPLFTTGGLSYPSGHASGMEVQALILATVFPAQKAALLARAQQIAESRVVAGVHYPSDIKAGIALGDQIFAALEATPNFKDALAAAAKADNIPLK